MQYQKMTGLELTPACGGKLIDLTVAAEEVEEVEELKTYAGGLPSLRLSERAVCDLELLATGGFSPLQSFMGRQDYERVLQEMRLSGGHLFPVPVTLPIDHDAGIHVDQEVALRNARNELLALMTVEDVYEWNLTGTVRSILGTDDGRHPLVAEMHGWGRQCLGTAESVAVASAL